MSKAEMTLFAGCCPVGRYCAIWCWPITCGQAESRDFNLSRQWTRSSQFFDLWTVVNLSILVSLFLHKKALIYLSTAGCWLLIGWLFRNSELTSWALSPVNCNFLQLHHPNDEFRRVEIGDSTMYRAHRPTTLPMYTVCQAFFSLFCKPVTQKRLMGSLIHHGIGVIDSKLALPNFDERSSHRSQQHLKSKKSKWELPLTVTKCFTM